MMESIQNAKEELKRIDHLVYVTLKYTRTVDVLLSVIERMINAYEFIVDALLENAKEEGMIQDIPKIPLKKAHLIMETYDSKRIKENMKRYLLFRKLRRTSYEKSNEFRRHVTMTAVVDGEEIKVNIDSITDDFHSIKKFLDYVFQKVQK